MGRDVGVWGGFGEFWIEIVFVAIVKASYWYSNCFTFFSLYEEIIPRHNNAAKITLTHSPSVIGDAPVTALTI